MSNFEVVLMEFELPELSANIFQQVSIVFELYVPKKLCAYGAEKTGCTLKRSERRPFISLVSDELNQLEQTLSEDLVRPLVAIDNHLQLLGESAEQYLLSRNIEFGNLVINGVIICEENEEILQRHKVALTEKVKVNYEREYFDLI